MTEEDILKEAFYAGFYTREMSDLNVLEAWQTFKAGHPIPASVTEPECQPDDTPLSSSGYGHGV